MCRQSLFFISFGIVLFVGASASADLVAHWTLDDGSGTIAKDSAGGYDGTLMGDTKWTEGKIGGALDFDGSTDYVDCGNDPVFNPSGSFSVTLWAFIRVWGSDWQHSIIGKGGDGDRGGWAIRRGDTPAIDFTVAGLSGNNLRGNAEPPLNEWIHIACVYNRDENTAYIYINGTLDASISAVGTVASNDAHLYIGNRGNSGGTGIETWGVSHNGMLDDVRYYSHAVSESEIADIMTGFIPTGEAANPSPADQAGDVSRDVTLNWTPGKFANTHDVYFGTDFNDVNDATLAAPLGAAVQEGLDVNSCDPGRLDLGATYYWRVDEVNDPASPHTYKGNVWTFTVEPTAVEIPFESITATASSNFQGYGPINTINGSGLNASGQHSTDQAAMWLSGGQDANGAWVRYDFDKLYKVHDMTVWNYNFLLFINAGLKDVKIEYSQDGQTWTELSGVPQFAKGSGAENYESNTQVDFKDVVAQAVRITAIDNWSNGSLAFYGLSEVKFTYIPVWARLPNPTDEATDVPVDVTLTWRAGREAAQHHVYVSTDEQAVTDGTATPVSVNSPSDGPLALDLNRTYYWRADEVNDSESPALWQGDVWSFSTQDSIVVDDFEDYNDTPPYTIYNTWKDGLEVPAYGGSQMGNFTAPFAERTRVHGGRQSAPIFYDNTSASKSEVAASTSALAIGSDWSKGNPDTLVLWFRGDPNNTATDTMYVMLDGKKSPYPGDIADISTTAWKKWEVPLSEFSGLNLHNVTTITVGIEKSGAVGGSGTLYIDDIQLTLSVPAEPGSLIVNPSFEEDGIGNATPSGWSGNDVSGGVGTDVGTVSATDGQYYLWQGNGNFIYQTTNEVIASAGLTYKLDVDVRNSWNANPKIIVYYEDAGQRIELGSTTLPANGSSWPAPVTMEVTAVTTAASVGKKIGVELTIDNYPGGVWAHYDNVRFEQVQ